MPRPMDLSLPDFLHLSTAEKLPYIEDRAVLYALQFDRLDLDYYCRVADAARKLHKTPAGAEWLGKLLAHRIALNFFVQPSSRTFLSFNAAQTILGMKRMSVRDIKISSISKGESLVDSLRTFLSYIDLMVMRHSEGSAGAVGFWIASKAARRLKICGGEAPIPIVSGGSGSEEHPTQALLDIYTLEKSFEKTGGIDGKTIMLVGDLARGRTVRSLSFLMNHYRDVKLIFAAPEEYQMLPDVIKYLDSHNVRHCQAASIDDAVDDADAIYMTRIQDEWDDVGSGGHTKTSEPFIFRERHLSRMKPSACLMHPLPKRDEVEESVDYADDPRVVYWRQERNGMWMRVAVIAKLFRVDADIIDGAS